MEFGPLIESSWWPVAIWIALVIALVVAAFLVGRWSRRR